MPTSLKGGINVSTRAPKAWRDLMHTATVALPQQLSTAAALRRRLLRVRVR